MKPERPLIRYHGGKWNLAPWIIGFFPPHQTYVEPFGGGGSVLLQKDPAPVVDVYNDLDRRIVSLFRILRDPERSEQLRRLVELTPFARDEFEASYALNKTVDEMEAARLLLLRAAAGFSSSALVRVKTGFRSKDVRAGAHAARNWMRWPENIPAYLERLRGCVIEHQPAAKVIARHDAPATLFYVDPPYVHSSRSLRGEDYDHEMTDDEHRALARQLHGLTGMVVVSGYETELYDAELYSGWERHAREHFANGGRKRKEVVWLNPAVSSYLHLRQESFL